MTEIKAIEGKEAVSDLKSCPALSGNELSISIEQRRDETLKLLLESLNQSHPSVQATWDRATLIKHCIAMEPVVANKTLIAMNILASSDSALLAEALLVENRSLVKQTTGLANETKRLAIATFIIAGLTLITIIVSVIK